MAYDRFLIAPINEGIRTDLKPWIIPDDAFAEMYNAYVFRGRVRKRFGSVFTGSGWPSADVASMYSRVGMDLSLLRIALTGGAGVGETDGAGAAAGTVPGLVFRVGQRFSIGAEIFEVVALGTPGVMTTTGGATTRTFDTTTGAYVFAGAAATTQIYFYPFGNLGSGVTDAITGNVTGFVPGSVFKLGQQFTIEDEFYTVIDDTPGPQTMLRTDGGVGACTFDVTTGEYAIDGAPPGFSVYFYPSEPVMGISQFEEGSINDQPSIAWDTQFAYYYTGSWWELSPSALWHGSDSDFFWATTWTGATTSDPVMFATNFNATIGTPGANDDPLWAYDGTDWYVFRPYFLPAGGAAQTGPFVQSARLIISFHGRLLLLNTVEQNSGGTVNTHYPSRCRFCHYGSPFTDNAWYETNQADSTPAYADGGGWLDATTTEAIISAEFQKDRLIVYFEQSTWELAYTGNEVVPFAWYRINSELGADATFSKVSFDRDVLVVGNTGVHACNGSNVARIDQKIPDTVFDMRSANDGRKRVAGIRDFFAEMVYWTYPSPTTNTDCNTYPDLVLTYNYANQTWAFNEDSITAFGYFEQYGNTTPDYRRVIAGNQEGFIFLITTLENKNASVLQITDMEVVAGEVVSLVVGDHNLDYPAFIKVEYAQGITELNGKILQVDSDGTDRIDLIDPVPTAGVYTGGGVISRVSNPRFSTKQWNPYSDKGYNCQLAKIDFLVDKTSNGVISVDYFPSSSTIELGAASVTNLSNYGTGDTSLETYPYALYPVESSQERLWHTLYLQGEGECIQLGFYLNNEQISDVLIAESPFVLHALILYTRPTSSRLQ